MATGINALLDLCAMKTPIRNDDPPDGPGRPTPSAPPPDNPKTTKLESDGPSAAIADLVPAALHPIATQTNIDTSAQLEAGPAVPAITAPAATLDDPQAQDVHATTALAATPGNVGPLPPAQSALAEFVPEGGLHPASRKPDDAMVGCSAILAAAMEIYRSKLPPLREPRDPGEIHGHVQRGDSSAYVP